MFDLPLLSSGSGISGWKIPDLSKAHPAGLVLLLVARPEGRGNAAWTPTWNSPPDPILSYRGSCAKTIFQSSAGATAGHPVAGAISPWRAKHPRHLSRLDAVTERSRRWIAASRCFSL